MTTHNIMFSLVLIATIMAAPAAGAQHAPVNLASIRADVSGSWYNPEQSGHGLLVEILDNQRALLAEPFDTVTMQVQSCNTAALSWESSHPDFAAGALELQRNTGCV